MKIKSRILLSAFFVFFSLLSHGKSGLENNAGAVDQLFGSVNALLRSSNEVIELPEKYRNMLKAVPIEASQVTNYAGLIRLALRTKKFLEINYDRAIKDLSKEGIWWSEREGVFSVVLSRKGKVIMFPGRADLEGLTLKEVAGDPTRINKVLVRFIGMAIELTSGKYDNSYPFFPTVWDANIDPKDTVDILSSIPMKFTNNHGEEMILVTSNFAPSYCSGSGSTSLGSIFRRDRSDPPPLLMGDEVVGESSLVRFVIQAKERLLHGEALKAIYPEGGFFDTLWKLAHEEYSSNSNITISKLDGTVLYGEEVRDINGKKWILKDLGKILRYGGGKGFLKYISDRPGIGGDEDYLGSTTIRYGEIINLLGVELVVSAAYYSNIGPYCKAKHLDASDVHDHATLEYFVRQAERYMNEAGDLSAASVFTEDPKWLSGDVYLFINGGGVSRYRAYDPSLVGVDFSDLSNITDAHFDYHRAGLSSTTALQYEANRGGGYAGYIWDRPSDPNDDEFGSIKLGFSRSLDFKHEGVRPFIGSGIYSVMCRVSAREIRRRIPTARGISHRRNLEEFVNYATMYLQDDYNGAMKSFEDDREMWVHGNTHIAIFNLEDRSVVHHSKQRVYNGRKADLMGDAYGRAYFQNLVDAAGTGDAGGFINYAMSSNLYLSGLLGIVPKSLLASTSYNPVELLAYAKKVAINGKQHLIVGSMPDLLDESCVNTR